MGRKALIPVLLAFLLSACDGNSSDETPQYFQVQLLLDGLINLDGGATYEAFARIGSEWKSISRFNFNEDGGLVDISNRLISNTFITDFDMIDATGILVTIEDRRDSDLLPSETHVLQGSVSGAGATLTLAAAFMDLSGVTADYIVATPTDVDPGNEQFGVWLGTPTTLQAAMSAPVLTEAWLYELWIDLTDGPVSLGKFGNPAERDDASPFSAQPETFDIPGEDLLVRPPASETFPLAVAGKTIFVTLEPDPDDFEETPYGIRLLQAEIPAGATPNQVLSMTYVGQFPSGTASFR
jgi:hypothetical protein